MPPALPRATTADSPRDSSTSSEPTRATPTLDPVQGAAAKGIPEATIARLPVYLRALASLAARGTDTVSSGALAEEAGVNSAQLRKDLSHLGSYGTRGVGYDVEHLRLQIGREVGSTSEWPVVIVGLGNLGTALANYSGFTSRGFRVVAMVDPSPALIGTRIHDVAIADLADLEQVVSSTGARIAVLATPSEAAQEVADRLVYLGVTSILNFAASVLVVPDGVNVRKVDLGQELQILAYHEQRKTDDALREPSGSEPPGPDHPGPDHPGPDHPGPDHPGPDHPGPDHPGPDHPGPEHPGPEHPVGVRVEKSSPKHERELISRRGTTL